jgi:hypothetical protein
MDVDGVRCLPCARRRLEAQVTASERVVADLVAKRRGARVMGWCFAVLVGAVVAFILPWCFPAEYTGTIATLALPLAALAGYFWWAGGLTMAVWRLTWRPALPPGTAIIATCKGWWELLGWALLAACVVGSLGYWVVARRILWDLEAEHTARQAEALRRLAALRARTTPGRWA